MLRDEVYRIGREALINAFRHARAKSIEVELKYSSSHLRLLVRDDGCGIDPQVISSGREGHWGLSGMRERADRIGARLHVFSSATAGTEIELSVPSHVAFRINPRKAEMVRQTAKCDGASASEQPEDKNGKANERSGRASEYSESMTIPCFGKGSPPSLTTSRTCCSCPRHPPAPKPFNNFGSINQTSRSWISGSRI